MNILDEANKIVNERSEEKTREYGSFSEGMERAAKILSSLRGKEFDAHDMYAAMVALKFSRQSFNFKTDNLLDAVAYMGAWENYIQEQKDAQLKSQPEESLTFDFVSKVAEHLDKMQEKKEDEEKTPQYKVIERLSEIAIDTNKKIDSHEIYVKYLAEQVDKLITYVEDHVVRISNERNEVLDFEIDKIHDSIDELSKHVLKLKESAFHIDTGTKPGENRKVY